ncbi:thioredoxin domain-containing protein 11-like, partial [Anopheles bellator]|uniref:thioredoxin domain-containing protein 11-like n=1 Tax=Anopheles bellator TaxID=139047 RepID=UPI002648B9C1
MPTLTQGSSAEDCSSRRSRSQQPAASGSGRTMTAPVVDGKTRRYSRISMIIIYGREALCILALLLTTYATIQNTPPKAKAPPPPVPFFSRGSLVSDFPSGALGTAQARVAVTELSLVFYYAPWCAESQYARQAYESVAQLYHREAHFVAINCWQPGGECRQRYTYLLSWPVLMAYQPNGFVIQYQQAWTAGSLSRFVQSLVAPLQRFVNPADLMDRMTGKDAVIVAFLEVTNESKLYNQYYQAAVKWLEKDPFQEVSFGVVTGESCKLFGVETQPSIRLYLWNETIEYVGKESWTPKELNGWLVKHLQVVSMWIAPPGSKSSTIAPYFRQGPVLFLFNPRPLYAEGDSSDAYMMLRQLSMQYYNCAGDTWVQEMAREYIAEQRLAALERYTHRKVQCGSILGRHPSQDDDEGRGADGRGRAGIDRSTVSVSFVNVLNSSKFVDGRKLAGHSGGSEPDSEYCDIAPALAGKCQPVESCGARFGPERKPSLRWSGTGQQEEEEGCPARARPIPEAPELVTSSAIDSTHDYRGPKLLTKQYLRRQCELFRLAEDDGTHLFYPEPEGESDAIYAAIGGLSCKHNKTLTFLSMDSTLYHAFSERLGVDVLQEPNQTVAFIVDAENESTYALRSPINLRTLARFVHDYYNRSLERFQRSSNI